jgi:hypothetical protein
MSFDLLIKQQPLGMTPSHGDHTWNVVLNDYSAYTDIRLVVDVYKNPYRNDSGSTQDFGKVSRVLVPPNEYGNCIFNVETIITNLVDKNPRNLGGLYSANTGTERMDPYLVRVADSDSTSVELNTSQATIVNDRTSTISFSNGFNGGYEGFQNIYQINEYRLIFGVQFTSGGTTQVIIPTDFTAYTSYNEITGVISPYSASTQPYGIMIWPGVQDNKRFGYADNNPNFDYYYDPTNLSGKYNYWNYKIFDFAMDQGFNPYNVKGQFMATFGNETIPMTISGGSVFQTRYRTHYYKCPILLPFIYGNNPLYDNSSVIGSVSFLQKLNNNNQMNYEVSSSSDIGYTNNPFSPYSYLGQRIAYAVWKQNPNAYTQSDVAVYLSSGSCDYNYFSGVSEIVQYKMVGEECFNDPINFMFLNRYGVWDTYTFTKKNVKKYAPTRKVYSQYKTLNTKVWNRQSYDSLETVFYGQADELVTVDSNFVNQNDAVVIEELLLSPYVYIIGDNWTPINNQEIIHPYLIPCVVQNKEVKVFEQKYERIFQYTIELKQTPYRRFELPI